MAAGKAEYIPGVCNIGREEVRRRMRIAWGGLAGTLALFVLFYFVAVPPLVRLVVFFPAVVSAIGFLQAWWGFCVRFGLLGVFNFADDLHKTDTVERAEYRRQDRRTSLLIISLALLIGGAAATLGVWLPGAAS